MGDPRRPDKHLSQPVEEPGRFSGAGAVSLSKNWEGNTQGRLSDGHYDGTMSPKSDLFQVMGKALPSAHAITSGSLSAVSNMRKKVDKMNT